VGVGK
jgi:hypothetical protein